MLAELQRQKAQRLARSVGPSEIASTAPPSVADHGDGDDDGRSVSGQTESYVHASQVVLDREAGDDTKTDKTEAGDDKKSVNGEAGDEKKSRKSKAQLWYEMKIGCARPRLAC